MKLVVLVAPGHQARLGGGGVTGQFSEVRQQPKESVRATITPVVYTQFSRKAKRTGVDLGQKSAWGTVTFGPSWWAALLLVRHLVFHLD